VKGDEGDFYYVIESGRFQVERLVGGAKDGSCRAEEREAIRRGSAGLGSKRNASVISLGEGELLRLGKQDFNALLREPLLRRIAFDEAAEKVRRGALWLDVRYPSNTSTTAAGRDQRAASPRCATCSPCSTAPGKWRIARAGGAAPRRVPVRAARLPGLAVGGRFAQCGKTAVREKFIENHGP